MRKIIRFFLLQLIGLFALISFANAAGDLTLIGSSVTPTNLGRGQILTVNLNVKNIGTTYAADNHIAIYLNTAQSFTNAILLSVISLEGLAPTGQNTIQFVYPIPYNITPGTNYVLIAIDALDEIAESNEGNNNYSLGTTINLSLTTAGQQNLPYPMIYVHGLIGSNSRWDSLLTTFQNFYGWSYGGNMNFCLNQDGNTSTSNVATDYRDWSGNIGAADFYTVNFFVDGNGNSYPDTYYYENYSNQSGIVKQGYAIRDAIKHVLQATGRDKVILVGHSMGGLASREYLQNPNIWQTDGQHHVAKLLTIGTPHGGSNSTGLGLDPIFNAVDELSEAVRDLRYSYYTNYDGVYLFGGNENTTEMYGFSQPFCNVDVNCNGNIGNNITGLNYKYLPNEISYSCVIGIGNIQNNDGVVDADRADLNNYPGTVYADTFVLVRPLNGPIWHTALPLQISGCVQGIDEANEWNQAYEVTANQLYFGLITKQSLGGHWTPDYDDYKINVANGNLNIKVYNIPIPQERIDVRDASYNIVYTGYSNGKSSYELNTNLTAGQYIIEFSGTPVDGDGSWYFPYAFKLTGSFTTDVEEIKAENYFNTFNYPNPFNSTTTIAFTLPQTDIVSIKVYDLMGRLISTLVNGQMQEGEHRVDFDGSDLSSGIYTYVIQSGNNIATHKLNIVK